MFNTMFNFTSKTFLMGLAMVIAGILEAVGVPYATELVKLVWPTLTPDVLITTGVGMIFVRDAIQKLM